MSRLREWWHLTVRGHGWIDTTRVLVVDMDKHTRRYHTHNKCACGAYWRSPDDPQESAR